MIIRLAEGPLHTLFGTFRELLYDDGHQESIALVMGPVEQGQDIFCRVHSQCLAAHVFNSLDCDCREQMALAQAVIAQRLGYAADARQYTSAAEILRDLGVHSITLLTNNPQKVEGLQAAGIHIVGTHSLAVDPGTNERLRRRYAEKRQQGHHIPSAYT